jgi:alkyl hydroperoxide reductase subunit AhpC
MGAEHAAHAGPDVPSHDEMMLATTLLNRPAPAFKGQAYFSGFSGEGFKEISLDDYKGKWLVLFFFPAAFTGVCQSEVRAFSEELAKFEAMGAELVGASADTQFTLRQWAKSGEVGEVRYPLLSDTNHYAGAAYGVYNCPSGLNLRGLFIINPEGVVKYMVVHDSGIGRSTDETLRVLAALQSGGACDANWRKK